MLGQDTETSTGQDQLHGTKVTQAAQDPHVKSKKKKLKAGWKK